MVPLKVDALAPAVTEAAGDVTSDGLPVEGGVSHGRCRRRVRGGSLKGEAEAAPGRRRDGGGSRCRTRGRCRSAPCRSTGGRSRRRGMVQQAFLPVIAIVLSTGEGFATPLPQTAQTGANLAPISPACHHADRYLRDSRSTGAGSRYLPARDTYLHPLHLILPAVNRARRYVVARSVGTLHRVCRGSVAGAEEPAL